MKYSVICSFYNFLDIFDFLQTLTHGKLVNSEGNIEGNIYLLNLLIFLYLLSILIFLYLPKFVDTCNFNFILY